MIQTRNLEFENQGLDFVTQDFYFENQCPNFIIPDPDWFSGSWIFNS